MTGLFQALGYRFRVSGTGGPHLAELLEPLRIESDLPSDGTEGLSLEYANRWWIVRRNGEKVGEYRLQDKATTAAIWHITNSAVASRANSLVLHAAAVVVGDTTALIAGRSGAGKSTLTAALIDRGGRYMTDEAVVIGPGGTVTEWLPRPLGLDATSLELLGRQRTRRSGPVQQPVPRERSWTGSPPPPIAVILLDGIGPDLAVSHPTRAELVARLVGESFLPGARTQWGLERVELLSREARSAVIGGGSISRRLAVLSQLVMPPGSEPEMGAG